MNSTQTVETIDVRDGISALRETGATIGAIRNYIVLQKPRVSQEELARIPEHLDIIVDCGWAFRHLTDKGESYFLSN